MTDLPKPVQIQIQQKLQEEEQKQKRTKYGNKKTKIDGITFDSQKEAERYEELKMMLQQGYITELKCQHTFTLQEAFILPVSGEKVQAIKYIADFTYRDREGKFVVEDVKSKATARDKVYRLKKKMMAERGYQIREVM